MAHYNFSDHIFICSISCKLKISYLVRLPCINNEFWSIISFSLFKSISPHFRKQFLYFSLFDEFHGWQVCCWAISGLHSKSEDHTYYSFEIVLLELAVIFHTKAQHLEGSHCVRLSTVVIDSVCEISKNYYQQVFSKECKDIEKER